jgi:hypothetical protein
VARRFNSSNSSGFRKCVASVALCCVMALAGCTQLAQASKDGEKLDAEMHNAMAHSDWKGIYADAAPELRAQTNEDKFGTLFMAISKKLGTPLSCKQTGWNVNTNTSGTYLKSVCETKFSNNASGTETFEWLKTDGKYRLYGYHINSDELITR